MTKVVEKRWSGREGGMLGGDAEDAAESDKEEEEEDGFSSRCGCGCGSSSRSRACAARAPARFEGRGIIARVLRAHAVAPGARHSRAARYGTEGSRRISPLRRPSLPHRFFPFSSAPNWFARGETK